MNNNRFTLVHSNLLSLADTNVEVVLSGWEINLYSNIYDRIDKYPIFPKRIIHKFSGTSQEKYELFEKITISVTEICNKQLYNVKPPMNCRGICLKTELLEQCYIKCLIKAHDEKVHSIGFSLLGSGSGGYDPLQAYDIARTAINKTAPKLRDMDIYIIVGDYYEYSKLVRFQAYLNDLNEDISYNDYTMDVIDKKLSLYRDFDDLESKLVLSIKEHEANFILVSRQILQQYASDNTDSSFADYSKRMIAKTIEKWIYAMNESYSGKKYEHKNRSAASLAKSIDASPSTINKLLNEKSSLPSRDMLISLAIGMKLDKTERMKFILYGDVNHMYPGSEKEKYVESILESSAQMPDYLTINRMVYYKFGETLKRTNDGLDRTL